MCAKLALAHDPAARAKNGTHLEEALCLASELHAERDEEEHEDRNEDDVEAIPLLPNEVVIKGETLDKKRRAAVRGARERDCGKERGHSTRSIIPCKPTATLRDLRV